MLETLVISVLVCGSLSLLIILFTKFFLKSESYDDMIAKRKEQENEFLSGKSTKKEKGKKEKAKVKKAKSVEETGKPKAEVKPMIVEEETGQPDGEDVEVDEVEKVAMSLETQPTVSRRNKKKRRKNVSFSDDGESLSNVAEQEVDEIKPTIVGKEESAPVVSEPIQPRRVGKDEIELKRSEESPVMENGTSKKKKRKNRAARPNDEEIVEPKQVQQQQSQPQPEQQPQQPQIQKVTQPQQSSPKPQRQQDSPVEKAPVPTATDQASKKKKKAEKRTEPAAPVNNAKPVSTQDPNAIGEEAKNLIGLLELTPLSRVELKTMAKALTDKGGPAMTDPDEALQIQMQILQASESAMREELLKERNNSAKLSKSATDRIQALNIKIVELQNDLSRANQSLQEFRPLREENDRLKASLKNQKELEDRYKIVTDQFAINASQLDSTERAKKTLETVVERLQAQLKTFEKRANMEGNLNEQLNTAQKARAAAEAETGNARREVEKAQATLRFEQERATKAECEVASLKLALQTTKAELRGAAEGQEDPAHQQQQRNANSGAAVAAANARQEQLEKLVKEKESTISDLESQVQRLNQQIDSQRQKNNVLRERNWALVEEMKRAQGTPPGPSGADPEQERVIALLRQKLDTSARIRRQLESRLNDSSERLQSVQAEADKVARLTQSVRAKEKEIADLQQMKETLESRVAALQSETSSLDQLKQQLSDRTADIANLRKENEELRSQQARQKAASVDDSAVLACLQAQVDELKKENELLKSSGSSGDGDDKLQREIEALRSKNNELREKNWKTVEALNAAQTDAERRIKEATESGQSERRELQQRIRQLESEATANQGWRGLLQKAEQEKQQVEEEVSRYKAALSETEAILRDLENSVESEEKKWQAALHASEQECERARRELATVYGELKKTGASNEDLSDLDFAYRCVEKSLGGIVDEMEEKLATYEVDLAEVTRQRDELAERLAEMHNEQSTPSSAPVSDAGALTAALADLEDLRAELELERKTKKELAQQNTKFNALVRIGQDALKEEQDLVKKLQRQLEACEQKQQQNGGKAQNAS